MLLRGGAIDTQAAAGRDKASGVPADFFYTGVAMQTDRSLKAIHALRP